MLKEGLYEELISKKLEGELAVLENGKYDISNEELTYLLSKANRNLGILEGMAKTMPNIDIVESIFIKKGITFILSNR